MALMTIMLIAGCDDGPSQKTDYGKQKVPHALSTGSFSLPVCIKLMLPETLLQSVFTSPQIHWATNWSTKKN